MGQKLDFCIDSLIHSYRKTKKTEQGIPKHFYINSVLNSYRRTQRIEQEPSGSILHRFPNKFLSQNKENSKEEQRKLSMSSLEQFCIDSSMKADHKTKKMEQKIRNWLGDL